MKCLSNRLRIFKKFNSIFSQHKIEKLTREIKHFNQKLTYHKKIRVACMKFFDVTNQIQQNFHNVIVKMSRKITIFEQRFENY